MEHSSALSAWEAFYVIVGSSGGALVGLQFVVITLIAERRNLTAGNALRAFGTPTVVHFGSALVVSAIMSAPWPSLLPLSFVIGAWAVGGVIYAGVVTRRARRQTQYQPVFEDWVWYVALPVVVYAVLAGAAVWLPRNPTGAAFAIGTTALGLLLIGIHNAWDSVVHIVLTSAKDEQIAD
jgi:hypothetical protein